MGENEAPSNLWEWCKDYFKVEISELKMKKKKESFMNFSYMTKAEIDKSHLSQTPAPLLQRDLQSGMQLTLGIRNSKKKKSVNKHHQNLSSFQALNASSLLLS